MKKYINTLLIALLVGGFMCSCSDDNNLQQEDIPTGRSEGTTLSIGINLPEEPSTRASGNHVGADKIASESHVYSLAVLIFKPDATGDIVGKGFAKRTAGTPLLGASYNNQYNTVFKLTGIDMTAGTRDVYIIANAPDDFFKDITKFSEFKSQFESLGNQGVWKNGVKGEPGADGTLTTANLLAHPNPTKITFPKDGPIGGITASDLQTSLTMCASIKGVEFDRAKTEHFIGFGAKTGATESVPKDKNGNELTGQIELVRMAARVAIGRIKIELPAAGLKFPGETNITAKKDIYYHLDGISLVNARSKARFTEEAPALADGYVHGDDVAYSLLEAKSGTVGLEPGSIKLASLYEGLHGQEYDITKSNIPLWFYTFENLSSKTKRRTTKFVIGVVYKFKNAAGDAKSVKYYYPVAINETGNTDNSYIKPNHQYRISVTIKGITGITIANGGVINATRSLLNTESDFIVADDENVEIETEVGTNLFPWAGDKYIINN